MSCARRGTETFFQAIDVYCVLGCPTPLNNLRQQSAKGFDQPSGYWRSLSISDWHFTKQGRSAETRLGEAVNQPSRNIGIRQQGSQGAHEPVIRLLLERNLWQRSEIVGVVYLVEGNNAS